ncbi:MAG: LytR/AlgR family response regulator transcription factor [Nannocystaceae bacterium]|nr:LytTR family transcriptional regulator [bacterium]
MENTARTEVAAPEGTHDGGGQRLYLRDGGRMLCICVDEIEWVAAAGNYIEIHTGRKTHLVRHTVKAMVAKLNPDKFLRVRPSAIVNVAEVDALEGRAGGDYWVKLRNGTQIPSSRSYRDRIEEVFGKPARRRRRRSDA